MPAERGESEAVHASMVSVGNSMGNTTTVCMCVCAFYEKQVAVSGALLLITSLTWVAESTLNCGVVLCSYHITERNKGGMTRWLQHGSQR